MAAREEAIIAELEAKHERIFEDHPGVHRKVEEGSMRVEVFISDCCDSCDMHACDDTLPTPRLAVTVTVRGRRRHGVERWLLRWADRHMTINGDAE